MIRTRLEIDIMESAGHETDGRNGKRPQLVIKEHPTNLNLVVFEIGELRIAVNANELSAALKAWSIAGMPRYEDNFRSGK